MKITIHRSRAVKYEVETDGILTHCTGDDLRDEARFAAAFLNQHDHMWQSVGAKVFSQMVDAAWATARYAPNEGVPK